MINKILKLLLNQFWPVNQFKNCNVGTVPQKIKSYEYNQINKFLLEIPILNWIIVSLICSIFLIYLDSLSRTNMINILSSAFFGILLAISNIAILYLNKVSIELLNDSRK
jgi:Na+/alanine symporter